MAKNNLIPTRIVDKNGKVTTVHKSAGGNNVSSSLASSAPALNPAPSATSSHDLAKRLFQYTTTINVGKIENAIDHVVEHDRDFIPFVLDRFQNGSNQALTLAVNTTKTELTKIVNGYADEGINRLYARNLRSRISRDWNIGSVIDELGLDNSSGTIDWLKTEIMITNRELKDTGRYFLPGEQEDNTYWRGVTAMVLSGCHDDLDKLPTADVIEFMSWAGKQEDLGSIVDTAKERKTLNVSTIQKVMALKASSPSALRNGTL